MNSRCPPSCRLAHVDAELLADEADLVDDN